MCRSELPNHSGRGRPRKYCGADCAETAKLQATEAYRNGSTYQSDYRHPCAFCGTPSNRGKFCSDSCAGKPSTSSSHCRRCGVEIPRDLNRYCPDCPRVKEQIIGVRSCRDCGTMFWVHNNARSRNKKTCSATCPGKPKCPITQARPIKLRQCAWCGKAFNTNSPQRYCSKDCRSFMAWYKDKRRALHWRIEYLTCPNPTCGQLKIVRPGDRSRTPASCDPHCEAAFRLHQIQAGYSPNIGGRYGWIAPSRRLAIYQRDNWICQLCDKPVDPTIPGGQWPNGHTLDHIIPKSLGGTHDDGNLQLAHASCNSTKGTDAVGSQLRLAV